MKKKQEQVMVKMPLNDKTLTKPPLGVMPQQIWMEKRAKDLARAIHQYIDAGMYEPVDEWVEELDELWQKIIDGWNGSKGCDKDQPPF